MKKAAVIACLLAVILLLSACSAAPPTTSDADFGITVEEATAQLREKAASLSFNAFETEPEVLDIAPDSGFTYTVTPGVLLAIYGTPEGLLNSVYLQVNGEECTVAGLDLVEEYTALLIEHFTHEAELERVTTELTNVTPMNGMKTSSSETGMAYITMMSDDTVSYLSIIPPLAENETEKK